ncbi:MAG TPA: ABC transporter permease [Acidimicrobiia bacterium]|nr:ABC transporter permease [Acidimicrobiia bacterium]
MSRGRATGAMLLSNQGVVSVAVVALGVLLSVGLLAVTGADLGRALPQLAAGAVGSSAALEETLRQSIPIMLIGLGVAIGLRAGLFNIGGEGQLYVAALAAVVVAQALPLTVPLLAVPLIVMAGAAAGALWGGAAGWMRARLGMNEVITTILLNEIGFLLASYAVHGWLRDQAGGGYPWSHKIAVAFRLPVVRVGPLTIPLGVAIALAAALLIGILLERSHLGFRLRTLGDNPDAAAYSGSSVAGLTVLAMGLAGLLAGLAGVVELAGNQERLSDFFSPGYGFTAIAVALVGNARAGGVVIAALLFGALRAGASSMERIAQVPAATSLVAQAIIILLLVVARSDRLSGWIRRRRALAEALDTPEEAE